MCTALHTCLLFEMEVIQGWRFNYKNINILKNLIGFEVPILFFMVLLIFSFSLFCSQTVQNEVLNISNIALQLWNVYWLFSLTWCIQNGVNQVVIVSSHILWILKTFKLFHFGGFQCLRGSCFVQGLVGYSITVS